MKHTATRPYFFALLFSALLLFGTNEAVGQNGLHFDGVNDYVSANSLGSLGNSPRTVEAWIRTSVSGTQRVIVDMGLMPLGQRFTLNVLNGLLRIEIGGGGVNSTSSVADGNWHHVAATYNPAAVNRYALFIDGVPAGSGNISQTINTTAGTNLLIGTRNDQVNRFLGEIDEVRVWNYNRTPAQILADMNASYCSPQPGLLAYYKMNQGTAGGNNAGLTSVIDNSGNMNNGTLNGFALNGATSNWVIGSNVLQGAGSNSAFAVSSCGSYTSPSGNFVWSTNGTYNDTIPNAGGCDSAMSITVTILQAATQTISEGNCYSYTSPSGNHVWTMSGTYQDTLAGMAANGCDSILTIQLSIYNNSSSIISVDACDSLISPSGNHVWDSTGMYMDTLMNVNGCDSFLTVFLTVNQSSSITYAIDGCDSYFWPLSGQTYTTSTTDTVVLTSSTGCDSTVIMSLGLNATPSISIAQSGNSLVATFNPPFSTLQWLDCNNGMAPVPGATSSTFSPPSSGSYACVAEVGFCPATSACLQFTVVGIDEARSFPLEVYPNPSKGRFVLNIGEMEEGIATVVIYNLVGKRILETEMKAESAVFDLKGRGPGTYFVHVRNGSQVQVAKVIVTE